MKPKKRLTMADLEAQWAELKQSLSDLRQTLRGESLPDASAGHLSAIPKTKRTNPPQVTYCRVHGLDGLPETLDQLLQTADVSFDNVVIVASRGRVSIRGKNRSDRIADAQESATESEARKELDLLIASLLPLTRIQMGHAVQVMNGLPVRSRTWYQMLYLLRHEPSYNGSDSQRLANLIYDLLVWREE